MISKLVNQINHLGYKITQDSMHKNTWKIASPNNLDDFYTLDFENNSIFLYKNNMCLCQVIEGEDPFVILRYLPEILFLNSNKKISFSIETLYDFCNADTVSKKNLLLKILKSKRISQFKSRRDYANYISCCIVNSGFKLKNKSLDLSLIDIILNIV